MLGLSRFTLLALALSASAFAGPHSRQKRRHHHPERHVGERSNGNSTHTLSKRAFQGRGTFYDVGLGACGQYSVASDFMVALNGAQYGSGYPGPQCFKKITIQANGVTVSGVTIMDECPSSYCPFGALDLSRGLFTQFAPESTGVLDLTWWFEGDAPAPESSTSQWVEPTSTWTPPSSTEAPSPPPTSTWTPPPTSTSTWVAPSSTSTWVEPSSSAAAAPSSSSSSTSTFISTSLAPSSSAAYNSTNPFAIVSTDNSTAASTSLSASASASSSAGATAEGVQSSTQGNLVALNGLVAAYGQLIVTGAGGYE